MTTVEGALRMAAPGYEARGALAPAQAYDASDFLETLAPNGISYGVEELD